MDLSKGTSGESFRAMMLRVASGVTVVSIRSLSSRGTYCRRSNLPLRFDCAPRPRPRRFLVTLLN